MNWRRVHDSVLAVALGFGFGATIIAANNVRQRGGGELLGDLDFSSYCAAAYPRSNAVLSEGDAKGWRCIVFEPIFRLVEIDVDDACSTLFDKAAQARTSDLSSPYEWKCYRA